MLRWPEDTWISLSCVSLIHSLVYVYVCTYACCIHTERFSLSLIHSMRARGSGGGCDHIEWTSQRRDIIQKACSAVCRSVLQCVAVCCSVLQCVVVCCSVLQYFILVVWRGEVLQCVAVAVCCSMLFSSQLQCVAVCYSRRVAVCCSLIFASFDVGGYYIEERIKEEKIIQDFWLELLSPQHLVLQMCVCI